MNNENTPLEQPLEQPAEQPDKIVVTVEAEPAIVRNTPPDLEFDKPEGAEIAAAPVMVKTSRKPAGGMMGIPEIAALVFSGVILLSVLLFYFFALRPAESDLKTQKIQRDDLEIKLKNSDAKFKNFTTTQEMVGQLTGSVEIFESRHLPIASIGRTGLYDRINGLMSAYGLRNTSGPDYSPLEITQLKPGQEQAEKGKAKLESLFPGVYINMTVEGSYVNMRRFIREIESSQQFVVISAVELQAAENSQQTSRSDLAKPPQQSGEFFDGRGGLPMPPTTGPGRQPAAPVQRAAPKGKTLGEAVSLHIELAAYFRRDETMGTAPVAQ